MQIRLYRAIVGVGALALGACSHPAKEAAAPSPSATNAAARTPVAPGLPEQPRVIHRADLQRAVAAGLGVFLQHVRLEDQPVLGPGAKFVGWKIHALATEADWRGVDLKPGDVVLSVNGGPLERPDDALAVFNALRQAKEIRVAIVREGARMEVAIPIVD